MFKCAVQENCLLISPPGIMLILFSVSEVSTIVTVPMLTDGIAKELPPFQLQSVRSSNLAFLDFMRTSNENENWEGPCEHLGKWFTALPVPPNPAPKDDKSKK